MKKRLSSIFVVIKNTKKMIVRHPETSLKRFEMWYKVNELKSKGLNKSQISAQTGLDRKTVKKYLRMSREEFISSGSFERDYPRLLDNYRDFIVADLREFPFLSAPQVHDHLKERYPDLPSVTVRTVYNYVESVRKAEGIAKTDESTFRDYEMLPLCEPGEEAQADFGEQTMTTADGNRHKVYFFVMVLSHSRYKFVFLSDTPFTTALAVYSHELAFDYFGGIPAKILYDQDRVLLKDLNLGELILTKGFSRFVGEYKFDAVFCHKADPESKGKVENVVKYVKYNFLRGRHYKDIETLNRECVGWLERTANGTEHATTRRIPSEVFATVEKARLTPYHGVPTAPVEQMRAYVVRKNRTVWYHGNYYELPVGSYKGQDTRVYVTDDGTVVSFFDTETGKAITTHPLSREKGKKIGNGTTRRDNTQSLDRLQDEIASMVAGCGEWEAMLLDLRSLRGHHYRDNLLYLRRHAAGLNPDALGLACRHCRESGVTDIRLMLEVARSLDDTHGDRLHGKVPASSELPDMQGMIPQKRDMKVYDEIIQNAI